MRWSKMVGADREPPLHSPETIINLLGLGTALALLGDTALYVVLATHTAQASILLADVGLMLSANRAIRIFLNSPYGMFIERIPRRRILVPSQVIGVLSTLLYAVPGFWPLLIGRLLWGIAWMGIWMGGSTAVLDVTSDANRGRFVGRYHMWGFIGLGVGALSGGLLVDTLGYRVAFVVMAAAGVLSTLVWALFLPETRPQAHTTSSPPDPLSIAMERGSQGGSEAAFSRNYVPTPSGAQRVGVRTFGNWLNNHLPLLTAIAIMGLNWLIFLGVIGALLPLLMQARIGEPNALLIPLATLTGAVSAASQVFSLIAAPVSGWLSDRSGSRWLLVVAALVLGVAALLVAALGHAILAITGIFLGAIATGILQTQAVALAGDYGRASRSGRILGVLNTVGDLGSAAGPVLGYALLPTFGLGGIFGLSAFTLLLILPWTAWIGWRERRRMASVT